MPHVSLLLLKQWVNKIISGAVGIRWQWPQRATVNRQFYSSYQPPQGAPYNTLTHKAFMVTWHAGDVCTMVQGNYIKLPTDLASE